MRKELGDIPRLETCIAMTKGNTSHPDKGNIRAPWLEPTLVWKAGGISALVLPGAVEEDISTRHNNEIDNSAAAQQLD